MRVGTLDGDGGDGGGRRLGGLCRTHDQLLASLGVEVRASSRHQQTHHHQGPLDAVDDLQRPEQHVKSVDVLLFQRKALQNKVTV